MRVGQRIERLRAAYGESLREAAQRTGVSHTTIARIEKGEAVTSLNRTFRLIAEGYGVSLEYLLTGRMAGEGIGNCLRLQTLEELPSAGRVLPARFPEYVKLVTRAIELEIDPDLLDHAIDLLAPLGRHKSLARQA